MRREGSALKHGEKWSGGVPDVRQKRWKMESKSRDHIEIFSKYMQHGRYDGIDDGSGRYMEEFHRVTEHEEMTGREIGAGLSLCEFYNNSEEKEIQEIRHNFYRTHRELMRSVFYLVSEQVPRGVLYKSLYEKYGAAFSYKRYTDSF